MNCTINTDASFSFKHQRGAFAFWIVNNHFRIQKAGRLKGFIKRPEVGEMMCIINALHTLYKSDCSEIKQIYINTDCLNAIHLFCGHEKAIKKYGLKFGKTLVDTFNKLRKDNEAGIIPIEFRHVKAHTNTKDARSYVNDWCDKNAKIEIGKLINELEK